MEILNSAARLAGAIWRGLGAVCRWMNGPLPCEIADDLAAIPAPPLARFDLSDGDTQQAVHCGLIASRLKGPEILRGREFTDDLRRRSRELSDPDIARVIHGVGARLVAYQEQHAGNPEAALRALRRDLTVAGSELTRAARAEPADVMPRGA